MNNIYEKNILYIHSRYDIKKDCNVLNHFTPIKKINKIVHFPSFNLLTMSKHISIDICSYKNIVVVIPEVNQSFENLIYYNFEDYNYLRSIINDDVIFLELMKKEHEGRFQKAYEESKNKFHKLCNEYNGDICRIQKKIDEILDYDEWPLDVYYVYEKDLKKFFDKKEYFKFKPKKYVNYKYVINPDIAFITPDCIVGFGDFLSRFGNLYCVVNKIIGFKIIRSKYYGYNNKSHTDGKSLFTFYDSPFYQHFEINNLEFDTIRISFSSLNLLLFYDINYTKKIIGNRLGLIFLDCRCPSLTQELANIYSDLPLNFENRYKSISIPKKSYFKVLNLENLVVIHIRLGDCVRRGLNFTYKNLIKTLSNKFDNETVHIVIISDGLRNINDLQKMDEQYRNDYFYLYDLKKNSIIKDKNCKIVIHDIVIGTSFDKDYLLINYIYNCKYMIEVHSSLPIVIAESLGKPHPKSSDNTFYINVNN